MELAFADGFNVGQRRPDEMLNAGILGGAYGSGCLLEFARSVFLEAGYEEHTIRPLECGCQGFGAIQVRAWSPWQWNGVCALGASFFGGARTTIGGDCGNVSFHAQLKAICRCR
jgi:hypothetical protein